jgi:hypothetical protein
MSLGGSAGLWPSTGTDTLIERVGGEIGAAGPDNGSALGVSLSLGEALRGTGSFKDGSTHAVEHINLAGQAIGEGQSEDAVANDLDSGDIRG